MDKGNMKSLQGANNETMMVAGGGARNQMDDSSYFDQMRMPGDTEFSKKGPNPNEIENFGEDDDLIGGLGIAN